MKRQDIALVLALAYLVAATVLEISGIVPVDQVVLGAIFAAVSLVTAKEANNA